MTESTRDTTAVLLRLPTPLLHRIEAYQTTLESIVGVPVARHDVLLALLNKALDALGAFATAAPSTELSAPTPEPSAPAVRPAPVRQHSTEELTRTAAPQAMRPRTSGVRPGVV
jgi:hypothetical protein